MTNAMITYIQSFFFFNDTATTEIYTLSLHDALPIRLPVPVHPVAPAEDPRVEHYAVVAEQPHGRVAGLALVVWVAAGRGAGGQRQVVQRAAVLARRRRVAARRRSGQCGVPLRADLEDRAGEAGSAREGHPRLPGISRLWLGSREGPVLGILRRILDVFVGRGMIVGAVSIADPGHSIFW